MVCLFSRTPNGNAVAHLTLLRPNCPSPLLAGVLPRGAASAELRHFRGLMSFLEKDLGFMQGAASKRREEFAAGRLCAAKALNALGIRQSSVGREEGGAPIWPEGIVGSISHTENIAAAVVARASSVMCVGLDIEERGSVAPHLWQLLFCDEEISYLKSISPDEQVNFATSLFVCKEAFYKAQWPITREWVDFLDVNIVLNDLSFSLYSRRHKRWGGAFRAPVTGTLVHSQEHIAAIILVPTNGT